MTQGQKDNAKRFKAVQVEAKKLKAKNPKLKHIEAIKKAWSMFSTGVKKSAKKKVGAVKIVQKDKNEKVTKVLKQVRNKKTGQFKGYKQIAGVKTKKVSGRTGTAHKDSKSHNVNIRVVSGTNNDVLDQIKYHQKWIQHYEKNIATLLPYKKNPELKKSIMINKKKILIHKKHITQLKKHI